MTETQRDEKHIGGTKNLLAFGVGLLWVWILVWPILQITEVLWLLVPSFTNWRITKPNMLDWRKTHMRSVEWFPLNLTWASVCRVTNASDAHLLSWSTWGEENSQRQKFPWEQPQELGDDAALRIAVNFYTNPIRRWGFFFSWLLPGPVTTLANWVNHPAIMKRSPS